AFDNHQRSRIDGSGEDEHPRRNDRLKTSPAKPAEYELYPDHAASRSSSAGGRAGGQMRAGTAAITAAAAASPAATMNDLTDHAGSSGETSAAIATPPLIMTNSCKP